MIAGLAPMDGITDSAYRTIVSEIFFRHNTSDDLMMWTEFMSADGYTHQPRRLVRHLMTTTDSPPVIAQIYGGHADTLLATAIDIDTKYHFLGIELNIGCPSPKIMACEAGSGMLRDRPKTLEILRQMSQSLSVPFSIKTRCGLTADDREEQKDFILAASAYCQTITIHGRTYRQSHSGTVDRDFIYDIKRLLSDSSVRVIGNGGLTSYEDGCQHLGPLDGVMRWQAAMCHPRVVTPHRPDIIEIRQTIFRHLQLSVAHEIYFQDDAHRNPDTLLFTQPSLEILQQLQPLPHTYYHSVIEFRKFLFRYVSGMTDNKSFKQHVATITEYHTLYDAIHHYLDQVEMK